MSAPTQLNGEIQTVVVSLYWYDTLVLRYLTAQYYHVLGNFTAQNVTYKLVYLGTYIEGQVSGREYRKAE